MNVSATRMTAPKLELSVALSDNPNTRPLIDGRVEAEGLTLIPSAVHPSEMFWRQLRFGEFQSPKCRCRRC
jgi:4,5-dihydroxyphthalate decarboxylase